MSKKLTVPEASVYQEIEHWRDTYQEPVEETLTFSYDSDQPGATAYLSLPFQVVKRLGVGVMGVVTNDDSYDWEKLDVHASTDDDDEAWEDENGEEHPYKPRSFLAGEEVQIDTVYSDGRTALECGAIRYGAMPAGCVEVDFDTILDSEMRELARRMLAGTYTPAPRQPKEKRTNTLVAERHIFPQRTAVA